jgi:N-methylhydantoinase A
VPALPGALSALGILVSNVVKDYSRTMLLSVPGKLPQARLAQEFGSLEKQAAKDFREEAWQGRPHYQRSIDLRYSGQGYELNLPFTKNLLADFQQEHHRRYGYTHPTREVELVTLRLRAAVKSPRTHAGKMHSAGKMNHGVKMNHVGTAAHGRPGRAKLGSVFPAKSTVLFVGKKLTTKIYSRDDLKPGQTYSGPAILTEYSATTVIPPGKRFHLDRASNLIVTIR